MRTLGRRSLFAARALAAAALLAGAASHSQRAAEQQGKAQPTRRTPAVREVVYENLSKAEACAHMGDMDCSRKLLEEVRNMKGLSSYEIAQTWSVYGYIYTTQDDYKHAAEAYENVLKQPDIPLALETTTLYALASLYVQQEQYAQALDVLKRWFAVSSMPGPDAFYLEAVIYYQLEQYRQGIASIDKAIGLLRQQGSEPKEAWYQLRYVLYYQLGDVEHALQTVTALAEHWPKKQWVVALAGLYGEQGDADKQLVLYEAAYEAGWLTSGQELVNLAQMLLQAGIPYKAAVLLQGGLDKGTIEPTEPNWRLLSQAWQLADEDSKALPALKKASALSNDGALDYMLAQSYTNLDEWGDCVDSARRALERGGLKSADQARLLLGDCLAELKKFEEARTAFEKVAHEARNADSKKMAEQWLEYLDGEQKRQTELSTSRRR